MTEIALDNKYSVVGDRPFVVVGIPAFNEEKTIAKVILKAQRFADKVIVCDDGSTDMTGEIAKKLGAIVIRHERNLGKGAALRSLFESGRKMGVDVLVTLDADDQHNPEDIPRLVEPILKGNADIAIGNRFQSINPIPTIRRWGNRVLSFLTSLSAGMSADTQSGFRAYSGKALHVIDVVEDGLGVDSQIFIEAKEKGLRIVEIPISVKYPKDAKTSKKNIVKHGSEVIIFLIELISEKRPLLFLGLPGLVLLILGAAAFTLVLSIFNQTRQFAIGTAMLGVVATLLGALLIFGALILWVLGERLSRIEKRISNR